MTERGAALVGVLQEAQRRGFLGPGPVEAHVDHAQRWASVLPDGTALDLGAGAGVPALVLAHAGRQVLALDAHARRCAFLRRAAHDLALPLVVLEGRAEELGQHPELRACADVVVARGFGPPAVTAECAAGFVRIGGVLSVSEPPGDNARWDPDGLQVLGFGALRIARPAATVAVAMIIKEGPTPPRYPRGVGVPRRRPLW